ncbi:hypothetical protein Q5M85_03910 [Paraclostridium bifermentans]|nr:hypothetical protein [Paraclostridium bifermentans]
MCGIGPFIPHKDTPLKDYEHGSLETTVICFQSISTIITPSGYVPASYCTF